MKHLLTSVLSLVLLSAVAVADVTITSKNGDIYACNAGILHPGDETLFGRDSIVAKYEDLTVAADSPVRWRGNSIESNYTNSHVNLFTGNSFWVNKVSSLQVALTSEKTGASYYVDYCYVAPRASGPQVALANGIYQLKSGISLAAIGNSAYAKAAGLTASLYAFCDLAGAGKFTKLDADASTLARNGMDRDAIVSSTSNSLQGQALDIQKVLNSNYLTPPRACVIRFLYSETKLVDRPNTSGAEFTNDVTIEKIAY